jgi:hypothetical protein
MPKVHCDEAIRPGGVASHHEQRPDPRRARDRNRGKAHARASRSAAYPRRPDPGIAIAGSVRSVRLLARAAPTVS